jgi:hypothetical protein
MKRNDYKNYCLEVDATQQAGKSAKLVGTVLKRGFGSKDSSIVGCHYSITLPNHEANTQTPTYQETLNGRSVAALCGRHWFGHYVDTSWLDQRCSGSGSAPKES